jgi:hypothetical protein
MEQAVFPQATLVRFAEAYPASPEKLTHHLLSHPLLTLESLVGLGTALPEQSVEYNPGDLPIGIAPQDVPRPALSIADTIRSIEENGSWMVLKRVEQHPDYAVLLDRLLDELRPVIEPATGRILGREGFIFIASPDSVTPFHFDPEHNILLQVRGRKTMTVFPVEDEQLVSAEAHERYHLGKHHRNHPWREEFSELGTPVALAPGEAIHVPVKAPHWVRNGPEVSISLSITWRSDWSYAEADARAFNYMMRHIGLNPRSPGAYPAQNRVKSLAFRAIRKAGLAPIE